MALQAYQRLSFKPKCRLFMIDQLQILQANVNKSSNVCHSLFNDPKLAEYTFLLISEPWARLDGDHPYSAPMFHSNWNPIFPTV